MTTDKIRFTNRESKQLAALLDLPVDRQPLAYAVFAHCFTCTKNSKAAARISRTLAGEGIAVLRFDFTGLGSSEGDFAETDFSSNVDDLLAAADFLEEEFRAPTLLVGHSLGGTAALQAATAMESIRAVITIAAPSDPSHVVKHFEQRREEIMKSGEAEVDLGGRSFTIRRQFLEDLRNHRLEEIISELKKPLLVMHSPYDRIVAIDHAARIFQAARHPKSFMSLDTADHLVSEERDAVYAGRMAASWARRFLDIEREDPDTVHPENRVVARLEEGFRTEIIANGHALVADEPESMGGTNTGPSPYDLLTAGLGACTAMTVKMYAEHKKLPLEAVTVTLRHEKIHAADCEECETANGKIDRIERTLEISGDLNDEQRQRMLEIADRCPVHKTLHSEVNIVSRLEE